MQEDKAKDLDGLREIITESNLCNMVQWKSWEERLQRVNQLRDVIKQYARDEFNQVIDGFHLGDLGDEIKDKLKQSIPK